MYLPTRPDAWDFDFGQLDSLHDRAFFGDFPSTYSDDGNVLDVIIRHVVYVEEL
jgi:hypothetical protein